MERVQPTFFEQLGGSDERNQQVAGNSCPQLEGKRSRRSITSLSAHARSDESSETNKGRRAVVRISGGHAMPLTLNLVQG